jgi:alkylation response protein AidB-like acyl-CoA dehydrogenase
MIEKKNPQEILEAARFHHDAVICPNVDDWESSPEFPLEAAREAARHGLLGLYSPEKYGGQALSYEEAIPVFEELGKGEGLYAFSLSMHNIVTFAICSFGQNELREEWASRLISGESLGGFVLTEAQSGSDAAGVTTRAVINEDGSYTIDGSKAWVSLADVADVYLVVVNTSQDAGKDGIAMIAVPKDCEGLSFGKPYEKLVSPFLPIADMYFDSVTVPGSNLIFPPGRGLSGSLMAIDIARTCISAGCCGLISSSLDLALTYARDRQMFGKFEIEFQGIQWMLADLATDLEASRLLYRKASKLLGTPEGTLAAAHAKRFAPDAAQNAAATCMQVLGGAGLLTPSAIERNYRIAPVMKMVDGTTEIQRVVIGRSLQQYAKSLPPIPDQECK